eukprot:NODE_707_length_4569_cov_0.134228.p4 type:complete len:115 gc:universal NODE_707_length_4569_cov_0.134228:4137-3793(-)
MPQFVTMDGFLTDLLMAANRVKMKIITNGSELILNKHVLRCHWLHQMPATRYDNIQKFVLYLLCTFPLAYMQIDNLDDLKLACRIGFLHCNKNLDHRIYHYLVHISKSLQKLML